MSRSITKSNSQEVIFAIAMWLLSRIVIVAVMQVIPSLLPAAITQDNASDVTTGGWHSFSQWDGNWYRSIVTSGYEFAPDGKQHNVAFFPLFPLLSRAVMTVGLPFEVAGTLVNNLAFLGALILLYFWVKERHGIAAARWATAVLAWCPFSIFATVTYTEGLFLLLSTASLQAFEKSQYIWASLWGAMATATRVNGVALIPTFVITAWRERRTASAYIAAIATSLGLLSFSIYCAFRFGDPLVFVHAQRGWQAQTGANWRVWWELLTQDLLLRKGWSTALLALAKVVTVFGSCYVLWHERNRLNRVAALYGFSSLAIIFGSGAIKSVERFCYATVSFSIALGILLDSHPRWGYAIISLFVLWLVYFSLRFSTGLWVA